MAGADREAILARRALFVASALAGLSPAPAARAEPCAPESTNADAVAEARELFERGRRAWAEGDLAVARESLLRAYAVAGNEKVFAALGQMELSAGDAAGAVRHFDRYLECAGEGDTLRAKVEELRGAALPKTAELKITSEPSGASVELDGETVGKTPLEERVNPGRHTMTVRWDDGEHLPYTRVFEVGAEEVSTMTIEGETDDCRGEPCVCLQPCLEPPLPSEYSLRWGVELGYRALIDVANETERHQVHGLRIAGVYAVPLGRPSQLRLSLLAEPSLADGHAWVPFGAEIEAALQGGPMQMGVALAGGYAVSDVPTQRGVLLPASGPYLAPAVVVGLSLSDRIQVGLRTGPLLSQLASDSEKTFRLSHVSAGLWLGYAFDLYCDPRWSDDCDGQQIAFSRRR